MKIPAPAACLLLAFLSTAAAAAQPQTRATFPQGLPTVFHDEDYPDEAIRNNEQGTVAFALDIGKDGRPTGCSITASSGSSALDAATCWIARQRPRFEPARDKRGRPTTDRISSRIVWKLPEGDLSPRTQAVFGLWTGCVMGEVAKLVPGDLSADEVAARSFPPCGPLELLLARETDAAAPLEETRRGMRNVIGQTVTSMRAALNGPPPAQAPKDR